MKRMKSLWIAVLLLEVCVGEGWYSQHVYCAEYQEWQARLSHLIGDERKSQGR